MTASSVFAERPPSEWKKRVVTVSLTAEQAEAFAALKERLEDIGDERGPNHTMSDGAVIKRGLVLLEAWVDANEPL